MTLGARAAAVATRGGNRIFRTQLSLGLAPTAFALVETTGRSSGTKRQTPVGNRLIGHTFWLVAALGAKADYVRNIQADPHVRVKVGRNWRAGRAALVVEDDPRARLDEIATHFGWLRRADAQILRALISQAASRPVTIRIDLHPARPAA